MVFAHNKKYIMLEGNRRTTALKIIHDVNILKGISMKYFNTYSKLVSSIEKNSNYNLSEIECIVFDKVDEANKWIELKHSTNTKGKGTIKWDTTQKRRYESKLNKNSDKKVTFIPEFLEYLSSSPFYHQTIKENLKKIPITNIERLISDPIVREFIGIDMRKNTIYKHYPDEEISKPINKILLDLIHKKIKVSDIYSKPDRVTYISTFDNIYKINPEKILTESVPLDVEITNLVQPAPPPNKEPEQINIFTNGNNSSGTTPEPSPKPIPTPEPGPIPTPAPKTRDIKDINKRKYLIPGRVSISIKNTRINKIYVELKRLEIHSFTNSVSVLFRVFLEMSLDEYIEVTKLSNVSSDSKLNKKVQECLEDLKKRNLIKKDFIKPVNVCVSDHDSIFSINTFNSYVHNKHMHPDSTQLKNSWNQLEGFIIAILTNC